MVWVRPILMMPENSLAFLAKEACWFVLCFGLRVFCHAFCIGVFSLRSETASDASFFLIA